MVPHTISFGRFQLRPPQRQLLADQAPVPLGSRALDVLIALVERRDRVVTKRELLDLAWPGLVVEENNLSVQVSALRKVLGSDTIGTIAGHGYRFTASITDTTQRSDAARTTPPNRIVRRLLAVASAEIVDWERLLARDESAVLDAWKRLRGEIIEPGVRALGGMVIEIAAPTLTVAFPSAADAVSWSFEFEQHITYLRDLDTRPPFRARIGITLEDTVWEDDRPIHAGTDTAAFIRQQAAPDQIVVVEVLKSMLPTRLGTQCYPFAAITRPNSDTVEQLYEILKPSEASTLQTARHRNRWQNEPRIAVLPFSTEGVESYFGDGVTEEIISSLARNRSLFVVARTSTLRYRSDAPDTARVAAELDVRYVLVGSVRRRASRLRIVAELVDSVGDRVIWSERFDGEGEELFAFQDQIAGRISAAVDRPVKDAELKRLRERPTNSFDAYDLVLRGIANMYSNEEAEFNQAKAYLDRAIDLDPTYAQAFAHLAWWHNVRFGEWPNRDREFDVRAATTAADRAVELDPRDAWILSIAGHTQSFLRRRFKVALDLFDQALTLNPTCAVAWSRSATTLCYVGRASEALDRVKNAMRLSPFDQQAFSFCTTNGMANIVIDQFDEAIAWLTKALRLNPRYRAADRLLIAALALNGSQDEASERASEFMARDPTFSVAAFCVWYPLQQPHLAKLVDGMIKAGLPR
jgi:adenylate cyclase